MAHDTVKLSHRHVMFAKEMKLISNKKGNLVVHGEMHIEKSWEHSLFQIKIKLSLFESEKYNYHHSIQIFSIKYTT